MSSMKCLSMFEDLPSSWPWGKVSDVSASTVTPVSATDSKGRGRGRGRARGRGRGLSGSDIKVDSVSDQTKDKDKDCTTNQRCPNLLPNLVRTGNQLSGSSTWNILRRSLCNCLSSKLKLVSLSSRSRDAEQYYEINKNVMMMLGKLPEGVQNVDVDDETGTRTNSKRVPALRETTIELLSFLGVSSCHSFLDSQESRVRWLGG